MATKGFHSIFKWQRTFRGYRSADGRFELVRVDKSSPRRARKEYVIRDTHTAFVAQVSGLEVAKDLADKIWLQEQPGRTA